MNRFLRKLPSPRKTDQTANHLKRLQEVVVSLDDRYAFAEELIQYRAKLRALLSDIAGALPAIRQQLLSQSLKGDKGERGEKGEPGKDGKPGEKGEPGRTPLPDIDYLSERTTKTLVQTEIAQAVKKQPFLIALKDLCKKLDFTERATDIIGAIESKKNTKDALDYYALKNLPDIPKEGGKHTLHRGGGGLAVYAADISSQCDGSNKTFTIPAHSRSILLTGTDFPIIYKPISDYTISGITLTLTAEVPAPISGASLIFTYAI